MKKLAAALVLCLCFGLAAGCSSSLRWKDFAHPGGDYLSNQGAIEEQYKACRNSYVSSSGVSKDCFIQRCMYDHGLIYRDASHKDMCQNNSPD